MRSARSALTGSDRLLAGWGRTAPSRATVDTPSDGDEAAALLALGSPRGSLARGFGRSYGDAAQNAGGRVIATTLLDTVHAFDRERGRVRVSAGLGIGALTRIVLPHGWLPAVTPGTQHVSIGGAIASDVHGKNHHRDGGFCEHVRGLDLALPQGGRVTLTPDGTPEAFWATAGGMGLTGVILQADLQLQPIETAMMRVETTRTRDIDETMERLLAADGTWRYTVAWVDLLSHGSRLGRGVVSAGEHAGAHELPPERRRAPLRVPARPRLPVMPPVPGRRGMLTPPVVRLFNDLYVSRAPAGPRTALEEIDGFFYPLDGVRAWNRAYGRAGLLQYQLVVPRGREPELRAMIERLVADRVPSYLAVLKRLGPSHGPLTFPMDGWTLAMDIPAAFPGLSAALDRLDEAVAACGGRVYLTKDARLRPELLPAMYPGLDRWRAERDRMDPGRLMRSDLARRLSLVGAERVRGAA